MDGVLQEPRRGLCAICLQREAIIVAIPCGHLVCCLSCRRRVVHQVRVSTGQSADTNAARRSLSSKQFERTKVPCPICRTEVALRHLQRFDGQVFTSVEKLAFEGGGEDNDMQSAAEAGPDDCDDGDEVPLGSAASSTLSCLDQPRRKSDEGEPERPDPVRFRSVAETREAHLKAQLQKLWKRTTTSLMNDHGMDSFLGACMYRFMQHDAFRENVHFGGRTGKYANKRRKVKIAGIRSGVRLDGAMCNGGHATITVARVEDLEQALGKLVAEMLDELSAMHTNVEKLCRGDGSSTLFDSTENLLRKYQARHCQRTSDLEDLVEHGIIPQSHITVNEDLKICMPQRGRLTTFLLDGTQLYPASSHSASFQPGETVFCLVDGDDSDKSTPEAND